VHFADWIGHFDVPGSHFVPGLLEVGSPGQVRRFAMEPGRDVAVTSLRLESFDNHLAPTFFALTVEIAGDFDVEAGEPEILPSAVLLYGGGTSHDYPRWFAAEDGKTLQAALERPVPYTDLDSELARRLPDLQVLVLSNNQPLPSEALRAALLAHVAGGRGLFLIHAATWMNWSDWPAFNRRLVGGGARSHEDYQRFRVELTRPDHPAVLGLPATFEIEDELYRFHADPEASIEVLAAGISIASGVRFPVIWTVAGAGGRILCTTLGHDGGAHEHQAFKALLSSGVRWLAED
jgi:type 1 glutamine amidotransferase